MVIFNLLPISRAIIRIALTLHSRAVFFPSQEVDFLYVLCLRTLCHVVNNASWFYIYIYVYTYIYNVLDAYSMYIVHIYGTIYISWPTYILVQNMCQNVLSINNAKIVVINQNSVSNFCLFPYGSCFYPWYYTVR